MAEGQTSVLIVDDNAINRAVLFDFIDGLGYRVLVAETGEAAVEIFGLAHPEIILMDIMLPGIDGYEACRQIRAISEGHRIPILFMSSLDDNQARAQVYQAGGDAHLAKPVIYDEVRAMLELHAELQSLRREGPAAAPSRRDPELEKLIDYLAHDVKTPLVCISGFAEELEGLLEEAETGEEAPEYASIIRRSAYEANTMLDALVLLKNLRQELEPKPGLAHLDALVDSAAARYGSLEGVLPMKMRRKLGPVEIHSDPILLEELILVLWRILSGLNPGGDSLDLSIRSEVSELQNVEFVIEAATRAITEEEAPFLLEPIVGGSRKKTKDTNLLAVCAQRLIEVLAINAWAEPRTEGLCLHLGLHPAREPDDEA